MKAMPDASIDAICCDPPSSIAFMNTHWDKDRGGRAAWCGWLGERMAEALRVAKPGSYALVWAIPRRSHWTALALEDAGWEISDRVAAITGQGFPKHKSKLKPAIEDWWLCRRPAPKATMLQIDKCRVPGVPPSVPQPAYNTSPDGVYGIKTGVGRNGEMSQPHPAGRWPSHLCLIHSPGCRAVGTRRVKGITGGARTGKIGYGGSRVSVPVPHHADADGLETVEEWRCVDGCAVRTLDEISGERQSNSGRPFTRHPDTSRNTYGEFKVGENRAKADGYYGDTGGASRFFNTFSFDSDDFVPYGYFPKASRTERNAGLEGMPARRSVDDDWVSESRKDKPSGGKTSPQANHHPTVKSLSLMKWLTKLICPPGGTVLDPFMGSGTTGLACIHEGLNFVGVESDPDYFEIASRRIAAARSETPLFDKAT